MPVWCMMSFFHRKLFYITAKGDGQKPNFKKGCKTGKKFVSNWYKREDTVDIYQVIYHNCVCGVCVGAHANRLCAYVFVDLKKKK